ncbi:lipopolysaccharide biosynthesis protein [Sediminibacterium ginsengisoli]|uniref:Membrane protein involved in the export of O-antigen and teichoic acid n=1 Tax=Sediminibacterium ginsengisoli TaxID=413434 RepID=A0A1T4K0P5_9BACT|nr:oligosaccharide flippase family protein [Sediminibacterium ginsengisoli]SJZ36046.1 Membrane protein involved in the export of O-antigen and teichoic acid [Sediminibacterium ginsengisoli]
MSGIKKLAGQTLWYGVSSIAARFINYLLTPYLTFKFSDVQYGEMSIVYAFIPFMNVVFTYGMETAFFRFANKSDKNAVYSTTSISLILSTIVLSVALLFLRGPLTVLLQITEHPEYLTLATVTIALDALCTIPFAKLRQDGRPVKFAIAKVGGILINIISIYFFLSVCPTLVKDNPSHWIARYFDPTWAVGYVLVANVIQNGVTLLLLSRELLGFRWKLDTTLWKEMMRYGMPLILAGFAGMINETFDRIMLGWWAPVSSVAAAKAEVGIYSACYKLSILITLAVQAFRMGAEPFFFKQAEDANAPKIYARVMKFFVITLCFMFLAVVLYLDIWKQFIRNPKMWTGLKVVPILLLANMFLGIYYNLSVWYKLGHKTMAGAWITLIGAAVTLVINWLFIPYFSYMACAWATFLCYGSMMVVSYRWGQKEYRIPYATKKLVAYMVIVVLLFLLQKSITYFYGPLWFKLGTGTLFLFAFSWFILQVERKEFRKLPVVGKYL